jgi:L-lysine 2,3-aminomutase
LEGVDVSNSMRTTVGARLVDLPQVRRLGKELQRDIAIVSSILPFKVNNYVIEKLIDWSAVPDDPLFRLTFPHRDMLPADVFKEYCELVDRGAMRTELRRAADALRIRLNPHPGDQLAKNVPSDEGGRLEGVQHKYRETVLIFPSHGQTCHAYCAYCFRWAQFVGLPELKQQVRHPDRIARYLRCRREVSDVLFTGGDPMIMSTDVLKKYVEPLLGVEYEHIRNFRFGTKALSYWPYRFTTDSDSAALLRMFERIVAAGRHVALMAHFSHVRELETGDVVAAMQRIRSTGAVIRVQAPLVRHVNDSVAAWADIWRTSVRHGAVPYYMFVERDTGAREYFSVPRRANLPRRDRPGLGPRAYGARAGDVGLAGQSDHRRCSLGGRRGRLRLQVPAEQGPGAC